MLIYYLSRLIASPNSSLSTSTIYSLHCLAMSGQINPEKRNKLFNVSITLVIHLLLLYFNLTILLMYPIANALNIHPWLCRSHLNSALIWIIAIGMITRSAALIKFASAHKAIVLEVFVNLAIVAEEYNTARNQKKILIRLNWCGRGIRRVNSMLWKKT